MNRLVGLKQFEITRGELLKFMGTLDDKIADTRTRMVLIIQFAGILVMY